MAAKGNKKAIAALDIPDFPDELEYLRVWAYELYARSGLGMDGAAPTRWSEMYFWRTETGRDPSLQDKMALMTLDAILRHPETPED